MYQTPVSLHTIHYGEGVTFNKRSSVSEHLCMKISCVRSAALHWCGLHVELALCCAAACCRMNGGLEGCVSSRHGEAKGIGDLCEWSRSQCARVMLFSLGFFSSLWKSLRTLRSVHVGRNVWAPFTSRGPHQLCDDGDGLRHRLLLGESC